MTFKNISQNSLKNWIIVVLIDVEKVLDYLSNFINVISSDFYC